MVSPYDVMGSGLQQPTKGFDLQEGKDLLSGLIRAPIAAAAFVKSASPVIGTATSRIRSYKRISAAEERRKEIWAAAQQTNYHKGAIRYLQEVRGLSSDEIDSLLQEEEGWQSSQRNTRPERISRALVPAVHEEDRNKLLSKPTNSVTLPSGKTVFLDSSENKGAFVNDSFEDSPWQNAIADYTKFYKDKYAAKKAEGFSTLAEYEEQEDNERQLNSYLAATNRIIDVNRDAAYSMESPVIRTQVEYMEALEKAKADGYPLGKVIEEERKHLSEGLYEIAKTAIGQGMPIIGMEGEDYIERAQYMGEMMGWQGMLGMFLGWANSPIDTIKYKPNLPLMMFAPVMYRVARGSAAPATMELFASIEAKNPRFNAAMNKLRSGGKAVKDATVSAAKVTGEVTKKIPLVGRIDKSIDRAFEAAQAGARKATDKLGFQRTKDGELIIGYQRAPAKLSKGQAKIVEGIGKKDKVALREILDAVGPGELAPVTLKEGTKRLIQSAAIGYLLGVEYEAGALSLARRSVQAIRTTEKGSAFMDSVRQNFSRSEGVKSTQEWARIKEAAEVLRSIPDDQIANMERELALELENQATVRREQEARPDEDVPYEVTGVEDVTPAGSFSIETSERPIDYEATRGLDQGTKVEPPKETAADVIINVDDVPVSTRAKPDDAAPSKTKDEGAPLPDDSTIAEAEARWLEEQSAPKKPETAEEVTPTQQKPEAVAEELPPASPPKGAGLEEVAPVFEVEPGVEIPYTPREAAPAVSSWYKDTVRRAIRKVTGRAPTKAQLDAIEKSGSIKEVKSNVAETFKDIDSFRAVDQKAAFFDEMINREEGATPGSTPISPKKLETLKALRDRFGENLGTLFDKDYIDNWKKRPGNKTRRFNAVEEVLDSVTDDGAIIDSSSLAKLTRGERFSSRGRGKQVKQSIIKEAEFADKEAKDAAAEVDSVTGRQDMTDPNRDTLQIKLRETERDFERAQKEKSTRELAVDKDNQLSKEERQARVEKDKASFNEKEGKAFKHSYQKLKEVAEALEDGVTPSTKGARSRKDLVEKLAEDPQAIELLNKFDTMKEKIGKYSSWKPERYKTKKGKWVTPKKESIKSRKFRRNLLERYAKEVMRSNLPQKMKTRLLSEIQPNAKSSPFRQIKKDGKPGAPYQSLGSHLGDAYPYKNLIEEIEAAKKGEYAPEAFMGAREKPALLEAQKDIRDSLKGIVDEWKAGKITANKAADRILDSMKEMAEDLALYQERGPTPEGATRGQVRTVTPKNKDKAPFRVQYVQPSYYGGKVRHRLASVERHRKNNRADFESGRSRINSDAYTRAAEREIGAIREYMESQAARHLDMIRKDEKSVVAQKTKAVLEESNGKPQGSLSREARSIIKDLNDGKEVSPDRISQLPLLEGYAVRDLIDSRPKSVQAEMNATKPATAAEVKQAKGAQKESNDVRQIDAESGTPKRSAKEFTFVDDPAPEQVRPTVIGRPTTKSVADPFVREVHVDNPAMSKRFTIALQEFLAVLTDPDGRIGFSKGEANAFAAGIFQVLKGERSSLLMSETMRARVLQSYMKEAREVRTSTGKKVFNDRDLVALERSVAMWLDEFSSPFFAPEGPAPWLLKEPNKFAEMITVLNRTPGNLSVRLDKRRLVYFEDVRAKVGKELAALRKEGIDDAVIVEAGQQATNNIKGRAVSKAFGRIIQKDLTRRGVTIDMTPAEAAAALAARELIFKEGRPYGMPNYLNVDGEIRSVTPQEIAVAAKLDPQAFIDAAENLIGRKLKPEEISDYIGERNKRYDKRTEGSRTINSESPVGEWLNGLNEYKKVSEKQKGVEYTHSIFDGLMDEIPEKERQLVEKEVAKVKDEDAAINTLRSEQLVSEAAYLKETYISPAWHESINWNAALRQNIEAFKDTNFGAIYGQTKRGATMLSAKTSIANQLSHFVNLALLTGESPGALASRFTETVQALILTSNWKPKDKTLSDALDAAREAFKRKHPDRVADMKAAADMNLVNTTMVKAELNQVSANRKYNLGWWGDFREWYYGVGDSVPKTAEFSRQRRVIKSKMSQHLPGEQVGLKTTAYTEMILVKNKQGKWEKLGKNDKFEEVSAKELDKHISVAAKVETDILIPDYNLVPRALKQARAGVGGKGWKQVLSAGAGLISPFLSYPYLMMDGPNKPGWLTRTFLSRSYDGPIRSTNKMVKAKEIGSEVATAARVSMMFGQMSLQYVNKTSAEEKEAGRKAVRWSGKVGSDSPAHVSRGKGGSLKVMPLQNMHSGSTPELAWGTLASTLMWAGDHIRQLVEGEGILEKEYEALSYGDKIRYDALLEIERQGGLSNYSVSKVADVFAVTGNHFSEAAKVIITQQNEFGQDLTADQAFVEAIAKIGPALAPGGTDAYNATMAAVTVAGEAADVTSFSGRSSISPYRNLIRTEELKKEKEYSAWTDQERMAFLIDNYFTATAQIYAREVDLGQRHALIDGSMSPRTPKVLNTYFRAFKDGYLADLNSEIKTAKNKEKIRLENFRDDIAKDAFDEIEEQYDSYLSTLKNMMLSKEMNTGKSESLRQSARNEKKRAREAEAKLLRQKAAGYRREKQD